MKMEDKTNHNEGEDHKVEKENKDEPTLISGLKQIGLSIFVCGLAYYFFVTMTSYENGEGIVMNRLLLLAYGILGKNITVGILILIGLIIGWTGIDEIIKSRKLS